MISPAVVTDGREGSRTWRSSDARGITDAELTDATHRSSLDQLTDWTQWADKILVF